MKELTGGKASDARMNYSNDTKCNLKATHILECNERPKLSGEIDDAGGWLIYHLCRSKILRIIPLFLIIIFCWRSKNTL